MIGYEKAIAISFQDCLDKNATKAARDSARLFSALGVRVCDTSQRCTRSPSNASAQRSCEARSRGPCACAANQTFQPHLTNGAWTLLWLLLHLTNGAWTLLWLLLAVSTRGLKTCPRPMGYCQVQKKKNQLHVAPLVGYLHSDGHARVGYLHSDGHACVRGGNLPWCAAMKI